MSSLPRSVLGAIVGFFAGVFFGVLPTVVVALAYAGVGAWLGYKWKETAAILPLIALALLTGCTTSVDTTEHCILTRYGTVVDKQMSTGLHFTPVSSATCFKMVDHNFPDNKEGKEIVEAQTSDPVTVTGEVAMIYSYDPQTVYDVFLEKRSPDAAEQEILNSLREGYRNAIASWTVSQIFSRQRAFLSDSVRTAVQRKIGRKAIIKQVFIRDIRAPQAIEQARIAAAQQAQMLDKQQKQFIIDSVTARTVVIKAKAEAEATLANARANAEATRLNGQSYQKTPLLLKLEVAKAMAGICGQATTCILGQQFIAGTGLGSER